jgi:acetoacetyl-CoA reductase/3-oxoacyl-[acyl-carrier protein] reductase
MDLNSAPDFCGLGREVLMDVANAESVQQTVAALGKEGLLPDILVNNAGITRDGVIWKLLDEDWDRVLDVNLTGAFRMIRAAVAGMREKGAGAIVNMASINGERGKFGQANYSASKAGLIALTKTAARELGRFGIRVNAVAPGLIDTSMSESIPSSVLLKAREETLLDRVGDPIDVAHAVLFLSSDLASHITGQVLRVDGGQYL